jgi:hypothetical protein
MMEPDMTPLEAVRDALAIVGMAAGPFRPQELAAVISLIDPRIGAAIPAACSALCVELKDGTGRMVLA